jgi:predicted NBD/HSP70 family sugar kinase
MRYFSELNSSSARVKNSGFDLILKLAEQGDTTAGKALDRAAHALGIGAAMMITGLAPDVMVIVGEITWAWERVGAIIKNVVETRLATPMKTRIEPADPRTQPRLRGTIALALQKHFGAPHTI